MVVEEISGNQPGPARQGPEQYAPRHWRGSNVVEVKPNSFEAEIQEIIRRGVAQHTKNGGAETSGDPISKSVNLLISRVVGESFEQIDELIGDLQLVRNMLRREGERVNREVANYVSLNYAVRTAMGTIRESVTRWQTPGQATTDENDPAA